MTTHRQKTQHLTYTPPRLRVCAQDVTAPLYEEGDDFCNFVRPSVPIHCQRDPVATTNTLIRGATCMLGLVKRLRYKTF